MTMTPELLPLRMQTKITVIDSGCWQWIGAHNSRGYGCIGVHGVSHLSHRVAYELLVGPIPDGLTIDHLCRNTSCCNPAHLEPVTLAENVRRAARLITHCKRGHPLAGKNLLIKKRGALPPVRNCRTCRDEYMTDWRARQAA